ncbi:MAG: hypothetical protein AAFR51_15625 [Pseudomonadota bacterium]
MTKKLPDMPDLANAQEWANELASETNRGCALLAASWLEESTKHLIKCGLVEEAPQSLMKEVFSGTGPYATFSSSINICFLSGYISNKERSALHLVRKVRNEFAHSAQLNLDFEQEPVSDLCKRMEQIFPIPFSTPNNKNLFCATAAFLLVNLSHIRRGKIRPAAKAPDLKWD